MDVKEFLKQHYTDCNYTIDSSYDSIVWDSDNPRHLPDEEYILEWISNNTRNYKILRSREYPSAEECLHAILDGSLPDLQIKRQAVKDKYPK